jgi:uncharacterized cupin superfamily protein
MFSAARRHPNVVHLDHVTPREATHGGFAWKSKRIWPEVGARQLACSWLEVPPGKRACPQHYHCAVEEAIFILEGSGSARIGDEHVPVAAGDYIAYPAGPDTAHSLLNTGDGPLRYLCFSTTSSVDIIGYPDSKKIAFDASAGLSHQSQPSSVWVDAMIREQPSLDYYDGEKDAEE